MARRPLDALLEIREHAVDQRAAALREQAERATRAREERGRADAALAAERDRQRAIDQHERARAERGVARAGDLAALASWQCGARERVSRLASEREGAERRHEQEHAAERAARSALGRADADARAVELAIDRRRAAERRVAEAREEEQGEELWNHRARRRSRKGSSLP